MLLRIVVLVILVAASCARSQRVASLPAPNPNGCYLIVNEEPDFRGAADVFNGPGRWPRLDGPQTNNDDWRNRIRSLRVGPAATVMVYTDSSFAGESQQFGPATDRPRLDARVSGRIESLELTCPTP